MWRKQEKNEKFFFFNQAGKAIGSCKQEELPLAEEAVIKKSILFFDDPTPCFIHKNAVTVRLTEEVRKQLTASNKPVLIEALPVEIQEYLNLDEEAVFIAYGC